MDCDGPGPFDCKPSLSQGHILNLLNLRSEWKWKDLCRFIRLKIWPRLPNESHHHSSASPTKTSNGKDTRLPSFTKTLDSEEPLYPYMYG